MSDSCELCSNTTSLSTYEVKPQNKEITDYIITVCKICLEQLENPEKMDPNHWRCLNESMWSEHLPVQVVTWRLLNLLKDEGWTLDLLEQLYLDEKSLEWAREGLPLEEEVDSTKPTVDSNGTILLEGDSVTLIKDLDVKGGGFTAKRGTLVKNITLTNNPKYIEGKVNGIQIVLVAAYLKKA
jgi:protein PhnA